MGPAVARFLHLTSLALHLLNVLALYALARRTFRAGWPDPTGAAAEGLALAVALLWGVHPLNTAAVNYLTQRGELLIALFSLLTLYAVNRAAGAPAGRSARWQVAAVGARLLGMGSKESRRWLCRCWRWSTTASSSRVPGARSPGGAA